MRPTVPVSGSGGPDLLVPILVVAVIGLLVWALYATLSEEESAGPEAGVTLSELQSDLEYVGSRVVVSGEITEIVGADEQTADDLDEYEWVLAATEFRPGS